MTDPIEKPEEFLEGIKANSLCEPVLLSWDDNAILATIRERDARQRAEGHAEGCRETIEQVREFVSSWIKEAWHVSDEARHSCDYVCDSILKQLGKLRRELEE